MQESLFKPRRANTKIKWIEKQNVYGGSMEYRKCARPLSAKKLTHVVFKAKLGNGIWFTRSQKSIHALLQKALTRYELKLKSFSIQKDHVHVLVYGRGTQIRQRRLMTSFLRFFSAEMGRKYKIIYKRWGLAKTKNLWSHRPFTRLVSWGRKSVLDVVNYLRRNDLEALGFLEYKPRKHRLAQFLQSLSTAGPTTALSTGP